MTETDEQRFAAMVEDRFNAIESRMAFLERASGLFADDRDLQGRNGDPRIKFDPKAWRGQPFKGSNASQCSPDFLDAYAEALAWMADHPKEGKEKYAQYDRSDAARCRSWARRIRARGPSSAATSSPTTSSSPSDGGYSGGAIGDDEDIPF